MVRNYTLGLQLKIKRWEKGRCSCGGRMNDYIIEYLDYYINLENPQYAVLLTGKWGCGKTYFIKKLIEKWKESKESKNKNFT